MTMQPKDIPYVGNPGNACALACYTMVAKHFFPEATFDEIARVSRWKQGYVVWEMPFWNWILQRDIAVTNYDAIDYQLWAQEGVEGLRKAVPPEEFQYYTEKTFDIESFSHDIRSLLDDPNFTHHKRNPSWDDLMHHIEQDAVCTVVLNADALDGNDGFGLHQVVILGITDTEVVFHDPRGEGRERPARKESVEHFRYAWLERVGAPSLTAYNKL